MAWAPGGGKLAVGIIASVLMLSGCGQEPAKDGLDTSGWDKEEPTLSVYNWPQYMAPGTNNAFTKATGITSDYRTYASQAALEKTLKDGMSGHDVVVVSNHTLTNLGEGAFMPLVPERLANRDNLDKRIMELAANADPGNKHAVVYTWGTLGIGFRPLEVIKQLGRKAPVGSWKLIFTPKFVDLLSDCGMYIIDDADAMIEIALTYLGKSPHSLKAADYKEVETLLMGIRPFISGFHTSGMVQELAEGTACAVVGYSSHMLAARAQGGGDFFVRYSIPKEGTLVWFDFLAIPADAPHPGNAHRYLDYQMEAAVAAKQTNYLWYANGNAASKGGINKAIRADPAVYPPKELLAKSFAHKAMPENIAALRKKIWRTFSKG